MDALHVIDGRNHIGERYGLNLYLDWDALLTRLPSNPDIPPDQDARIREAMGLLIGKHRVDTLDRVPMEPRPDGRPRFGPFGIDFWIDRTCREEERSVALTDAENRLVTLTVADAYAVDDETIRRARIVGPVDHNKALADTLITTLLVSDLSDDQLSAVAELYATGVRYPEAVAVIKKAAELGA